MPETQINSHQKRFQAIQLPDGATVTLPVGSHDYYVPMTASRIIDFAGAGYDGQKILLAIKNISGGAITPTLTVGATDKGRFMGNANAFAPIASGETRYFIFWYHATDQRWDCLGDPGDFVIGNANSKLSADVTMTNANQWYDAVSVSLSKGTWLVMGLASINRAATTLCQHGARISDGTTHYVSTQASHPSQNPHAVSLTLSTIIVLTATTTIKLQGVSSVATSGIIKAATANNGSGNNATQITAIKLSN